MLEFREIVEDKPCRVQILPNVPLNELVSFVFITNDIHCVL